MSKELIQNKLMTFFDAIFGKIEAIIAQFFTKLPKEINRLSVLIFCVIALLLIGSIMVASASMPYAASSIPTGNELHFFTRHLIYLCIAGFFAFCAYKIRLNTWFDKLPFVLIVTSWLLLLAVLFVGKEVNGSARWLQIGGITFQPSELAKFAMLLFTADYMVRREKKVKETIKTLARLSIIFAFIIAPIATQDLGAAIVVFVSMAVIIILAGTPLKSLFMIFGAAVSFVTLMILATPWRVERMLSFLDPWTDKHGTGYQLSQSLIAFGRGEITGVGLGQSVQKLAYLPEAHTDFMLAITAEEFGFIGVFTVFSLSFLLVVCCMRIGFIALRNQHMRSGYLAYGIASIFLFQLCVNAGMNMGIAPVKGLTLPFISYGGSSLVVCAVMIAVMIRIAKDTQHFNRVGKDSLT